VAVRPARRARPDLRGDRGRRPPGHAGAPVAHLWLEPEHVEHGGFVLRLRTWPGGEQRLLADAQGHGPPVVWR
jgi:hypothetical protein